MSICEGKALLSNVGDLRFCEAGVLLCRAIFVDVIVWKSLGDNCCEFHLLVWQRTQAWQVNH